MTARMDFQTALRLSHAMEQARPQIITEYDYETGNWVAFYEGWESGSLGYGTSKAAAIDDLENAR